MFRAFGIFGLVLVLGAAASAQPQTAVAVAPTVKQTSSTSPPHAPSLPSAVAPHNLTREDLEAYLDGMIPDGITRAGIAGAVVAVVEDGRVVLEKGYGFSDVDLRKRVDPNETMFRPGSISKLITWTAVMQLQEIGRLDLDKDVNVYLDFKIPDAFGSPITLRNLMTHTPGFEEHLKNLMADDPKLMRSLARSLSDWVPDRVYPPGKTPAYSNYGAALAGYIVQRVSGEPFEQYIERHIFQPLAMNHSTFVQPLPKTFAMDMSKGYIAASGDPQPFELINLRPAGALAASADDLAHFMIAHLNDGAYGSTRILKPETAQMMHGTALQLVPGIPGMGLGFYHEDRNGHVIVGHGGDTQWFHSDLHLILDQHVGLFISLNSAGHDGPITNVRKEFFDGIMDRYFPAKPQEELPALASAPADARKVAGLYYLSRRSFSNFADVSSLGQQMISANADGTISIQGILNRTGRPKKFREVAPNRWHEVHGKDVIAVVMRNDRVDYLLSTGFPQIFVVQPAPFFRSLYWFGAILGASTLMLLLTVLFWPVKAVLRWRYNRPFELTGRAAMYYRLTRVVALIDVLFIAGWSVFFTLGLTHLSYFDTPSDPLLRLLQLLGVLALVGVFFPAANFLTSIRNSGQPWWTKLTDGLLVLAALGVAYFILAYNFLTLSLNY